MTFADDEPLDDLKRAWDEVVPPDRSDALEDADPATRASVLWLRAAWREQPVPRPALPVRSARWIRPSAAAAAMIIAALVTFLATRSTSAPPAVQSVSEAGEVLSQEPSSAAFAAVAAMRGALTGTQSFPPTSISNCSQAHVPVERLSCAFQANRAGNWTDSIRYATPVADDPSATNVERCSALTHLVVAEYGLGREDEAQFHEARLVSALAGR